MRILMGNITNDNKKEGVKTMAVDFRKKYKVPKSNVEKSYEYQLGLKSNEEYEKRVDSTFVQIITLFKSMYPNVTIETPVGREKSNKSLLTKIENLEIERLCKLYAIEGLSEQEKVELYEAILKSIDYRKEKIIRQICYGKGQEGHGRGFQRVCRL